MDIWAMIAEERTSLIETVELLRPEQWDVGSLCGEWTVRQVLGHLVLAADPPYGRYAGALSKGRGSFDKANDLLAREEAERPVKDLIRRYRQLVGKRSAPPGLGARAPLSDLVLHSLDVRVPLDLPSDRPAERYADVLDFMFTRRATAGFVPRGRPALHWVGTDHAWTHGTGDEVHGTMADLALTASGRGARVNALGGPGQPAVAAWLHR
ncbi:MAG: maleylpyruvate isomerase family mycothiol-dependent enzyme [Acidimicrobiales bacterium]